MKYKTFFVLAFLMNSQSSYAVIKRHDVVPQAYETIQPQYLIDLPHEGHGVLIRSQWIVTVAHTIFYDYSGKMIQIGSKQYEIDKIFKHSDYNEPNESLFIGDAAPLMAFFHNRSDIALIKLSSPVAHDIEPISFFDKKTEVGMTITVFGRGATGDGKTGEDGASKQLRVMNSFQNVVEVADGNWLSYIFDAPPQGLPLEGMHGSGDSGGASVIYHAEEPVLVGLSSWQSWQGDLANFKGGLYGTRAYQVRLSSYANWILSVIGE